MMTLAVTRKALFQYGFIALPAAFAGFPLYVLAPDFYATQHGLSLTLLGAILLAIRLFDSVQDPLMGWIADRLQGRFLFSMSVAGAILCLSIFGLFSGSSFSPVLRFAVYMALAVSAYSFVTIVLGAQATLWTSERSDQTRISSVREAFALAGLLAAVSLPVFLSKVVSAQAVYLWYIAILGVLMIAGLVFFSRLSIPGEAGAREKTSLSSALRALSSENWRLFSVYGLSMLASSIPAVLVIFYVRDLLGAEQLTGLFLLAYFLSGALAMPFWKGISMRVGKHKAWVFSNLVAVAGFIGALFLGAGDFCVYAAVCVVSGAALGADLTLPPSILADQVHARNNQRYAGTHYASLAFVSKASLAIASAVTLPLLDAAGFKPNAQNSEYALAALGVAYALIPCLLKLAAASLLYFFFIRPQSGENHENI